MGYWAKPVLDREQTQLFYPTLDSSISPVHPVRQLDEILRGGLARGQVYLIEGVPGAGKTTLALQFALEGAHLGVPVQQVLRQKVQLDADSVAQKSKFGEVIPQRRGCLRVASIQRRKKVEGHEFL